MLVGAYTDADSARRDADRINGAAPGAGARVVAAAFAAGLSDGEAAAPVAAVPEARAQDQP